MVPSKLMSDYDIHVWSGNVGPIQKTTEMLTSISRLGVADSYDYVIMSLSDETYGKIWHKFVEF